MRLASHVRIFENSGLHIPYRYRYFEKDPGFGDAGAQHVLVW
jgi:hypothetical protein